MPTEASRELLFDRLHDVCGFDREALQSTPVVRSRATDVRFVTTEDGEFVVKTYRHETTDGSKQALQDVSREFKLLRELQPIFREGRWRIVKPAGCIPDAATLVTWRVPGDCLEDSFQRRLSLLFGSSELSTLVERVRDAGRWLKYFHGHTVKDTPCSDVLAEVLKYIDRRARKLSRLPAFRDVSSDLVGRILTKTQALIDVLESRGETVCQVHQDYSPGNIFHDGSRVTVIDFLDSRPSLLWQDLSWFRIMLEDKFENYGIVGRRRVRQLWDSFVHGYGESFAPDDAGFSLYFLRNRMISLTTLASRLEASPASLSRFVNSLGYKRQRKWLLNFCEA